jgi:polyhydroxybutyrate depolymerase
VISAADDFALWRSKDSCPAVSPTPYQLGAAPGDGTGVTVERVTGCADGTAVELVNVVGGGHTWPGEVPPSGPTDAAGLAQPFYATRAIWHFFQRFSTTVPPVVGNGGAPSSTTGAIAATSAS